MELHIAKKLFEIIPGTTVKGDAKGHLVCQTNPVHPNAISLPDRKAKYVYLHRVIIDNHLGKVTDPNKVEIHHKDEDPSNNALSNLEIRSKEDHARGHAQKKKFWKKSPRTKPGRKASALRVAQAFLRA